MLKKVVVGSLLVLSSLAQAQRELTQDEIERFNPLKCETNHWAVRVDGYSKRSEAELALIQALVAPAKTGAQAELWTNISYYLQVQPNASTERVIALFDELKIYLREIPRTAVPPYYAEMKQTALELLVTKLKTIPGTSISCVVPLGMGRMSGSNK